MVDRELDVASVVGRDLVLAQVAELAPVGVDVGADLAGHAGELAVERHLDARAAGVRGIDEADDVRKLRPHRVLPVVGRVDAHAVVGAVPALRVEQGAPLGLLHAVLGLADDPVLAPELPVARESGVERRGVGSGKELAHLLDDGPLVGGLQGDGVDEIARVARLRRERDPVAVENGAPARREVDPARDGLHVLGLAPEAVHLDETPREDAEAGDDGDEKLPQPEVRAALSGIGIHDEADDRDGREKGMEELLRAAEPAKRMGHGAPPVRLARGHGAGAAAGGRAGKRGGRAMGRGDHDDLLGRRDHEREPLVREGALHAGGVELAVPEDLGGLELGEELALADFLAPDALGEVALVVVHERAGHEDDGGGEAEGAELHAERAAAGTPGAGAAGG